MSENGTDRELVLGNKQLLAIFFVAALLCGVFFAVGYVVGGNSAKSTGSVVADSSTAAPAALALSVPETGASFVQVAAQTRPAADTVANSLRERGWPTILAESSKPDRVEILVGPYRDGVALADAKRKLIDLGFSQAFVHK